MNIAQQIAAHLPRFEGACTQDKLDAYVAKLLPEFQKDSKKQPTYRVVFRHGHKGYSGSGIYWDSRFGLRLSINGRNVAYIGFKPQGRTVVITQLQALFFPDRTPPLRWERFLVALLTCIVADMPAYESVQVPQADQLSWYHKPHGVLSDEMADHHMRMRRRYDGTARALKFRKNKNGIWEKKTAVD